MSGDVTSSPVLAGDNHEATRQEVARLGAVLAGLELELTEMRLALSRFEVHYYERVGQKYLELDLLLARLAEARAGSSPQDIDLAELARSARDEARRSSEEYERFIADPAPPREKAPITGEMKALYRTIASRIHPDRAVDDESRTVRTRLMAELNDAYAHGDRERMEDIAARWEASSDAFGGPGTAAREQEHLARVAARLRLRISSMDQEIARMKRSSLFILMTQVQQAEKAGRDLLGDLGEEIERKVRTARDELDGLGFGG
ncbi:MAG: hypothetical protein ED859_04785 [Desulfuromonadales bacterium]|nr:MAG: hypothetical protein ED859_04785 [Desulfuromonadales bacterium]